MLDEELVHIVPVLLGDGIRVFDHPGGVVIQPEPFASLRQRRDEFMAEN
jgi:hypothetical protein